MNKSVALFNLAQLYFLTDNEEQFLEYLDLTIKAYAFMQQEDTEFDSFYERIESFKNEYKKLVDIQNIEEAYHLVLTSDLFHLSVQISTIDKIDNQLKKEIDPDLLATKSLLETANGNIIESIDTLNNILDRYPNYIYAYYLSADIAYREGDEAKLQKLKNDSPSDINLQKFYEIILPINKKFKEGELLKLEEIYEKEDGREKQLLSFYLMTVSKKLGKVEEEKHYSEVFFEGNSDLYYLLATP